MFNVPYVEKAAFFLLNLTDTKMGKYLFNDAEI